MNNWIKLLEYEIDRYDKIFLFESKRLLLGFSQLNLSDSFQKKLLILGPVQEKSRCANITYRKITEEELQNYLKLFFTYEFSDKFFFISEINNNYASLYHFVDAGILSMEEMFRALLR